MIIIEDSDTMIDISVELEDMEAMEEMGMEQASTSTVENQSIGDQYGKVFIWKFENLSTCLRKGMSSNTFVMGGYKWSIILFPLGKNTKGNYLSVYLNLLDAKKIPLGSSPAACFSFEVMNQFDPRDSVKSFDVIHDFNLEDKAFGFDKVMLLDDLYNGSNGFFVEDSIIIKTQVDVRKPLERLTNHSKIKTGFNGLRNQGVSCYLNSLVQTLYHIPYFRKAVHKIPTMENDLENDSPSENLVVALQQLFYDIQFGDICSETGDLTKSFGWERSECFRQQDIHECHGYLCEKLEEKMKETPVNGMIQHLFQGHAVNIIECIDIDYKSQHTFVFNDLQLDVKGCRDVYESFDKYVEEEKLERENQYYTEKFGLQDAKKGTKFIGFPPVLQLHLKRFDYNFDQDTRIKVNDGYEFPLDLDLDIDNGKYLSPRADRSIRNFYVLHSVLVHKGGVDFGHYFTLIRPTLSDQWYKFDDELVTEVESQSVLEDYRGGEGNQYYSTAYMLLYVRESQKDMIMCSVGEEDIPQHLQPLGFRG